MFVGKLEPCASRYLAASLTDRAIWPGGRWSSLVFLDGSRPTRPIRPERAKPA